jgi:hypothetical protein
MRKLIFTAVGAAMVAAAAPASAATIITFEAQNGTLVGAFGNSNPRGNQTDTYLFDLSTAGNIFSQVGSLGARITLTNLDFESVKLNGKDFNILSTGAFELAELSQYITAGKQQTLTVTYRNAQIFSSYAGKLIVTPAAAVPEPATWALMLAGFAMVGATMRYRRRRTTLAFN